MKSSFLAMFTTDPDLETKGIVARYDDFRVLLARAGGGNKKFREALDRYSKPYRAQMENDMMSFETNDIIMAKSIAEALILKTWVLKKDDNGNPITMDGQQEVWEEDVMPLPTSDGNGVELVPFTRANMERLLLARPDWMRDVQRTAMTAGNYRRAEEGKDVKN